MNSSLFGAWRLFEKTAKGKEFMDFRIQIIISIEYPDRQGIGVLSGFISLRYRTFREWGSFHCSLRVFDSILHNSFVLFGRVEKLVPGMCNKQPLFFQSLQDVHLPDCRSPIQPFRESVPLVRSNYPIVSPSIPLTQLLKLQLGTGA